MNVCIYSSSFYISTRINCSSNFVVIYTNGATTIGSIIISSIAITRSKINSIFFFLLSEKSTIKIIKKREREIRGEIRETNGFRISNDYFTGRYSISLSFRVFKDDGLTVGKERKGKRASLLERMPKGEGTVLEKAKVDKV